VAFHTSPQVSQRQYALASPSFAVVVIDADRHAGHAAGAFTAELGFEPLRLSELKEFRAPSSSLSGFRAGRPDWWLREMTIHRVGRMGCGRFADGCRGRS
jgi:hypothetical protein